MNNTHSVDLMDAGYLYSVICGETSAADALHIKDMVKVILARQPQKEFDVLINLIEAKTASPEAIKVYAELMQNPQIGKVAFFGGSETARISAIFTERFAHKTDVNFFDDRAEAARWLKIS